MFSLLILGLLRWQVAVEAFIVDPVLVEQAAEQRHAHVPMVESFQVERLVDDVSEVGLESAGAQDFLLILVAACAE